MAATDATTATTADDHWFERLMGQRQVFNACRPEVHDVYRRWRAVAEEYDPPRLLLGETHVFDLDRVAEFYGDDDELGLAFNFAFMDAPLDPVALRGTPVLYYGDELGLPDTTVPDDRLRDPVTIRFRAVLDRDAARTPMPWTAGPVGGFTAPGVEPRLPLGDVAAVNVADQEADPGSVLRLVRALLRLRRAVPDLRRGDYADLTGALVPDAAAAWTFGRGPTVQVVLNFGASPVEVPVAVTGARLAVSTDRADEGSPIGGSLPVAAGRGVVLVGD